MVEFDNPLIVSSELARDGLEQVREGYLSWQREKAESFLTACYMNGIELWDGHISKINVDIDEAGGINSIKTTGYGHRTNLILCGNGERISLGAIVKAPAVALALPKDTATFDLLDTYQEASAQLSFGGFVTNLRPFSTRYELDFQVMLSPDHVEGILSGDLRPTQIGLSEVVTTRNRTDNFKASTGNRYEVEGRAWGAKLREAFWPDPYESPEAYEAWRSTMPFERLNVAFHATGTPVRSSYEEYEPELPSHADERTYFSTNDSIRLTVEGAQKIVRFGSFLHMFWKNEFGSNMPVPVDSAFAPSQRAISQ